MGPASKRDRPMAVLETTKSWAKGDLGMDLEVPQDHQPREPQPQIWDHLQLFWLGDCWRGGGVSSITTDSTLTQPLSIWWRHFNIWLLLYVWYVRSPFWRSQWYLQSSSPDCCWWMISETLRNWCRPGCFSKIKSWKRQVLLFTDLTLTNSNFRPRGESMWVPGISKPYLKQPNSPSPGPPLLFPPPSSCLI